MGLALAQSIQGAARRQTAQKPRPVTDRPRLLQLIRLEKDFLHHILDVGHVTQNAPGRAEHERSMLSNDARPVIHRPDLLTASDNALNPLSLWDQSACYLPARRNASKKFFGTQFGVSCSRQADSGPIYN